jgi:hypothetical protein
MSPPTIAEIGVKTKPQGRITVQHSRRINDPSSQARPITWPSRWVAGCRMPPTFLTHSCLSPGATYRKLKGQNFPDNLFKLKTYDTMS